MYADGATLAPYFNWRAVHQALRTQHTMFENVKHTHMCKTHTHVLAKMLRNYLVLVVFWLLVLYERCKRWVAKACFHWYGPSYQPTQAWGVSAPNMALAPLPQARPLHQRIVAATCGATNVKPVLCHWMSDPSKNEAQRPDVFVSSLADLHLDEPLHVTYSAGMATYAVTYKDVIVVPPSVKQATSKRRDWTVLLDDSLDVTKVFEQFSGPAYDFYVGSSYATQFQDVSRHLNITSADSVYTATLGESKWMARALSTEPIFTAWCQ